jgi:dimethylaniline monooxygenase (N-oxide forming)
LQAQLWILHLLQHLAPKSVPLRDPGALEGYELDYALRPRTFPTRSPLAKPARDADPTGPGQQQQQQQYLHTTDMVETKHGVDHESYAYQLALDIGAAPGFLHVWRRCAARRDWRPMWVWAMGPSFTTKLRMVGPYRMADRDLDGILGGELWGVTRRSGGVFCELQQSF